MKLKRLLSVLILATVVAASGFALENIDLRFMFETAVNFDGIESYGDDDGCVSSDEFEFSGLSPAFGGFTAEVVFNKTGIGWTCLMNIEDFNHEDTVDFDTRLFMTHHFFGTTRLVDLWLEAGVGFAGNINIDEARAYEESCDENEECPESLDFMDMSVYSHLAVGFALNPFPFMTVGTRLNWRPLSGEVPSKGMIEFHETPMFQAGFFIGLSFNIPVGKNREVEDEEDEAMSAAEAAELAREEAEEAREDFELEINGTDKVTETGNGVININIDGDSDEDVNININIR
jgi:hypothetical protein